MTLGTSIAVLLIVFAAIAVLAFVLFAWRAPRRKKEMRRERESSAPLADPPTITHYGHA